jgi:hypothetical protein
VLTKIGGTLLDQYKPLLRTARQARQSGNTAMQNTVVAKVRAMLHKSMDSKRGVTAVTQEADDFLANLRKLRSSLAK